MPTPVLMPQMGESIAEGTIVRWIRKVGDTVDRDEPLFEISTDKVDAEIPSPAAGVLSDIKVKEGETVPVNSVVATIGGAVNGQAAPADGAAPVPEALPQADGSPSSRTEPTATTPTAGATMPHDAAARPARPEAGVEASSNGGEREPASREDVRRARSSPLVRRIAREHNLDIRTIPGTGIGGRVTKHDILGFIERQPSGGSAAGTSRQAAHAGTASPAFGAGEATAVVPMSVMRRKIAEHMVLSRRTAAHVHSVFEVSFQRVARLRAENKAEYERAGANLTYMSFITKAVVDALRAVPVVNASLDGEHIVYRKEINIGIAVALDWGLIVPVIRNADEKNLLGLSRAIADLAQRARARQLKPEDVQGGTFTITNPGGFGAQFGMPIINQPQVAILGVGAIEKRAIVEHDAIAIRPMGYLTLGFDHRLIDGAVGDQFMARIKHGLEHFEENAV